jgi:Flp pilus assembly protein TadG
MVSFASRFRRQEAGVSLVEGLIVFPIVLLTISTFVEFGYAVYQWNQTSKAVAVGARLAAVSDPVATDFDSALADTGQAGDSPSTSPAVAVCGASDAARFGEAAASACDTDGLNRLVFGTDGVCDASIGTSIPGMCDLNPGISPANVRISYYRSGLGYAGRPLGPVASVTVEMRNLNFRFFLVGALLGLDSILIPALPVTITGEDLCSQNECS